MRKLRETEVGIIGSGIAGLSTACLLARDGFDVTLIEQNWLPGGCVSSYPRKHYQFESGATTLVGLDAPMPPHQLLREIGVEVKAWALDIPMQVMLKDGRVLTRYADLESWIAEAERVFGPRGQRPFWEFCFRISRLVWETSLRQRIFPPSSLADFFAMLKQFQWRQLPLARLAFRSMDRLLKKYDLHMNQAFVDFVNEQLLITAQNHQEEVNVLFGATALCYTLYPNYYVPGGMINLVRPLVNYVEEKGGRLLLRNPVKAIRPDQSGYVLNTRQGPIHCRYLVSAIPINNTLSLFEQESIQSRYQASLLDSKHLYSAFSLGIVFRKRKRFDCLHHQLHLAEPLPYTGSGSIFLSLSHPDDTERCAADEVVASVTTHIPDPANTMIEDPTQVEEVIFEVLEKRGILQRADIIFHHSSTPKAWQKWTGRAWGFVGGYPQYLDTKPWQMLDARLDHKRAYVCGDSTYPGQGIPGAALSGIIAYEKMKLDGAKPDPTRDWDRDWDTSSPIVNGVSHVD